MICSEAAAQQGAAESRAIFLDKDGTLVHDVPYNVDPDLLVLSERAAEGLQLFRRLGYKLFVASNQAGIAKGLFSEAALQPVQVRLAALFSQQQTVMDGFYYCPHHPDGIVSRYAINCNCRKPMPGLLLQAAREHGIALRHSWMIGDILHDVEAGNRAGCRTVLINNGNETEWELSALRTPDLVMPDLYAAALAIAGRDADSESAAP